MAPEPRLPREGLEVQQEQVNANLCLIKATQDRALPLEESSAGECTLDRAVSVDSIVTRQPFPQEAMAGTQVAQSQEAMAALVSNPLPSSNLTALITGLELSRPQSCMRSAIPDI